VVAAGGRAAALAAALDAADTMVVFKDRRMPVEHLAEPAEQALEMADRLARPA
jgi:precorrin-2 methylase